MGGSGTPSILSITAGVLDFQSVMLVLIVVAVNVISVGMLIHAVNRIYQVLGGSGDLVENAADRKERLSMERRYARQQKWREFNAERRAVARVRKERGL